MWSNTRENMIKGLVFWVRCRTTAVMLGTKPNNPDLHRDFVASKNPDPEKIPAELESVQLAVEERDDPPEIQMTVYPKARFFMGADGKIYDPEHDIIPDDLEGEFKILPFIDGYQIRGSFKESISMLSKASGGRAGRDTAKYDCAAITSYKKVVDGNWMVINTKIPLMVPDTYIDAMGHECSTYDEHGNLRTLSRPLRADTAKGPRTALATSEVVPIGTEFYFGIRLLNAKNLKACLETLDYKADMGMLQWRGGGKGTLVWTPCNKDGIPYEDLDPSQLTDQDLDIIARINKIIPGAVQVDAKLPDIVDEEEATEEAPKKKGRKKKADTEETADDQQSLEMPAEEEAPKKRGRKKKVVEEPTEE